MHKNLFAERIEKKVYYAYVCTLFNGVAAGEIYLQTHSVTRR